MFLKTPSQGGKAPSRLQLHTSSLPGTAGALPTPRTTHSPRWLRGRGGRGGPGSPAPHGPPRREQKPHPGPRRTPGPRRPAGAEPRGRRCPRAEREGAVRKPQQTEAEPGGRTTPGTRSHLPELRGGECGPAALKPSPGRDPSAGL